MQPRPTAMLAPAPTKDKSPPPAAAGPVPSWTPKAAAVPSAGEPAPARPKKKRRKTAARPTPPAAGDAGDAVEAGDAALVVVDAGAARAYRGKCLYQSRKCENERALKRNGLPHNLCEEHRSKQNQHQRKFDAKKFSRKRRSGSDDGEPDADDSDRGVPRDRTRPRGSDSPQPQTQTQPQEQPQTRIVDASPREPAPPRTPASLPAAPHRVGLAPPALYAGLAAPTAPTTSSFRSPLPPALGHLGSNPSALPVPGVGHGAYQRQSPPPPLSLQPLHHQLDAFASRPAVGYSLSELEAARILVPAHLAASVTPPAGFADSRPAAYQQPQAFPHQPQPHSIRRAASPPDQMRGDRSVLFRPQEDARVANPSARVLPSVLRPPPALPSIAASHPQGFAHGIPSNTGLFSPVPRLLALRSSSMPLVATSEALPSLAPLRTRPLPHQGPATSR